MLKMVRYLGNRDNHGEDGSENEPLFGVNTFAPVWEAMVDKIFGKLPQGVAKDKFNPHLKFVIEGSKNDAGISYQDDDDKDEKHRSTLRPDTIMALYSGVFILDSKYYKYGLTGFYSHLPGAESVCKQMAYAEYVQKEMKPDNIYNAFIMPYCADAGKWDETNAKFGGKFGETGSLKMCRAGYIYGDWKDRGQDYHKIHCILLDMKSVMRNYANNPAAQSELAGLIN